MAYQLEITRVSPDYNKLAQNTLASFSYVVNMCGCFGSPPI